MSPRHAGCKLHSMTATPPDLTLRHALDTAARAAIARAWHVHTGNLTHAAATLGLSPRHLHREIARLDLWPTLDLLGYPRQPGPPRGDTVALSSVGADS